MSPLEVFLHAPRVAYFSMEIALESAIPTYAGGLGVLAGDTVRSAADLELTVKVEDGHGIAAPIAGTAPAQRSKQDRDRLPID